MNVVLRTRCTLALRYANNTDTMGSFKLHYNLFKTCYKGRMVIYYYYHSFSFPADSFPVIMKGYVHPKSHHGMFLEKINLSDEKIRNM